MRRSLIARFVAFRSFVVASSIAVFSMGLGLEPQAAKAETTAAQRLSCMLGEAPGKVAKGRQAGRSSPDAADVCVAALARAAHDGNLPDLYRVLLAQLGGDAALIEKLPMAIGNAVLEGDGRVQIGNGKVMYVVPPPLAFDAGFTAAYLDGAAKIDDRDRDPAKLKLLAASCLDVKKDAGPCFSAGFLYGAQAFRARKASTN